MRLTMLDAAKEYLKLGLHPIPCHPHGPLAKKPLLIEWTTFQTEQPSDDDVETWWSRWPDANIALVMGRGTFAVDFDGDGAEALLFDRGILLPGAPKSKTANGSHVFLAADERVSNRTGLFGAGKKPNVDIRGDGGYVIVPPSIHETGVQYEWRIPLTVPFPKAPENLLAFTRQGGQPGGKEQRQLSPPGNPSWSVEALLNGVGEGARDYTCTRLAGLLLGKGLDAETVEAILVTSFAPKCTPPFDPGEVRKCVRSVAKREAATGDATEEIEAEHISAVMDRLEVSLKSPRANVVVTPYKRLNEFLCGGFEPGLAYLAGSPSSGKTAMALEMVRGAGEAGVKTLVISREMLTLVLGRRMTAQASGVNASILKQTPISDFHLAQVIPHMKTMRGLPVWMTDRTVNIGQVVDLVSRLEPDFLMVDYLQLVAAPREIQDRRQQVEYVSSQLKQLAQTFGIPVLCLSTLTKIQRNEEGEERQPHGSDLRESGQLLHDVDTLLLLWKKTPMADEVQLIIEKQRDGETGFIRMTFDSSHLKFSE